MGVFLLVLLLGSACSGGSKGADDAPTPTITPTATAISPLLSVNGETNPGRQAFRVSGESNQVSFSGEICSLEEPFYIDSTFPGGSARSTFTPTNGLEGITSMSGGGGGCTQSGEGTYLVIINEDGSGTITWIDSATLTCPEMSNSRTTAFSLPLQPAPDLNCS